MKFANIGLYLVAVAVALFLALTGIGLWEHVPYLYVSPLPDHEKDLEYVVTSGLDFWPPVVNFLVYFFGMLIPATVGVLTCAYVERKLFSRPATMHTHVVLPLAILVAIACSLVGYPLIVQYGYVFGVVLVFGVYSAVYQTIHAIKARQAAKSPQQQGA